MNYYMESTWNSAWVSITSVMMMMTEKIITTVIDLNILILRDAHIWSVKRKGEPEWEEGCRGKPRGCRVRSTAGRSRQW